MPIDDPFDDIFDEFERMLDDIFGPGPRGDDRPIVEASGARVDVHERDGDVQVVADLPGVEAEDVDLRCDGEVLHISAGTHDAHVELPVPVDETSADADFNNGVLSVDFEPAGHDDATLDLS